MDVVALGELLIDMTPNEGSQEDRPRFEANPGGAPANVLVALSRLGKQTSFIGKVGDDPMGDFLRETLDRENVHTLGLVRSKKESTTLALVQLDHAGERTFHFYPGADRRLSWEEVNAAQVQRTSLFHFGSVSMTHEPSRTATLCAAETAKNEGITVSFDPNLRPPLWDDLDEAKHTMLKGLALADIVKLSEEELTFLSGTSEWERGTHVLAETYDPSVILVMLGEKGCYFRAGSQTGLVDGYSVASVDATGAGDAFLGGFLYQWLEQTRIGTPVNPESLSPMIGFANAVGALATTRKGAIPAMPTWHEVRQIVSGRLFL